MSKHVNDVTKENWVLETFPEWGTYLNDDANEWGSKNATELADATFCD